MLRIINTTIKIPGLKKTMTLLHITDLHLTRADCRDNTYVNRLSADREKFFPNAEHAFRILQELIEDSRPDCTVLTGDIIDFPSVRNLETLFRFLQKACRRYLYTLGNHDWCYPNEKSDLHTLYGRCLQFAPMTNGTPDFQAVNLGGLLLIGLDNSLNQISDSQLKKFKIELEKGLPCLLFFHVPVFAPTLINDVVKVWRQPIMIGTPSGAFHGKMDPFLIPTDETAQFCRLIANPASRVAAVFSGHVHFEHEDNLSDKLKQYVTPLSCLDEGYDGAVRRIRLVQPD